MEELSGALSAECPGEVCGLSTVEQWKVIMTLQIGLDMQARGGGGVAERLHASCRHLGAAAEVQIREHVRLLTASGREIPVGILPVSTRCASRFS
jgi:hypothetical protein